MVIKKTEEKNKLLLSNRFVDKAAGGNIRRFCYNKFMDSKNNSGFLGGNANDVSLDRSIWKILVLGILGTALAFASGFFLQNFALNGGSGFLYSSLAMMGFLTVFTLCVFFIKAAWISALIVFVESVSFFALFYNRISIMVLVGAGLGFLFLISGLFAGRNELENSLEIKFWTICKKVMPKAIAGMAMFAGVIYGSFIDVNSKEFFISRQAFDAVVSPITDSSLIQGLIPGIDLSGSAEQTLRAMAANEIQNNPQLKNLPDAIKQQLQDKAVQEFQKQVSNSAGSPLNFQGKLSDTLYDFLVVKFYALPENIISSTPALVAIFIFLVIISLVWPIRLVSAAITFLVYEVLLALGFGAIIFEGRSKENVVLK